MKIAFSISFNAWLYEERCEVSEQEIVLLEFILEWIFSERYTTTGDKWDLKHSCAYNFLV